MSETISTAFREPYARRNPPERIVTFGAYLPEAATLETQGKMRYVREVGAGYGTDRNRVRDDQARLEHTRLVAALNRGRKWALDRFHRWLDPLLEEDIAIAVVPSHDPYSTETPIRSLAQSLVASQQLRLDATDVLVRHTAIRRIVFGGPSTITLHRDSISVQHPEKIQDRVVLLLDDIVKSGNSLIACRDLLTEPGARVVQPVALGLVSD